MAAQVTWWHGSTASGSSGSPLIDMDTHKVVGVLTGGFSSCDTPKQPDYYGRLSAARSLPCMTSRQCLLRLLTELTLSAACGV
jgi:hypothetical protein